MIQGFLGWKLPEFTAASLGKRSAQYLNSQQVKEIFNRLTNIALSRFKWINLPDSCNAQVLEMTLYFYGWALFFYDEDIGQFLHTPCNLTGPFNIYWQSVNRHAYGFEYHKDYTIDNSVLIKNDHTFTPDYLTCWTYAPKIADGIRAIDVHTQTLKRPFIVKAPQKELQSVRNTLTDIADNEIAVIGERGGSVDKIEVLQLPQTSNLSEMWANIKNYYNQVFNALGVKNNYTEKRERMITSEVEGEGNAIRHSLEAALDERKQACANINEMFGLNVDVEANELEDFMEEMLRADAARVTGIIDGMSEESPEEGVEE